MSLELALLADIHLDDDNADWLLDDMADTVDRLERRYDPDRLVVLGDLIQEVSTEVDARNIRRIVDTLDRARTPVRWLLGNHDITTLSRERVVELLGNDRYGTDESLVFLDLSAPRLSGGRGELADEQLSFLERALATRTDALLFVHHPVHYHRLDHNPWFSRHPEEAFCGNKRAVQSLFDDRVAAVFNGHLHEMDFRVIDGVAHVTVPAFNRSIIGAGVGAYATATLSDDGSLSVRQVDADGLERTAELPR
jgi:Icc protein